MNTDKAASARDPWPDVEDLRGLVRRSSDFRATVTGWRAGYRRDAATRHARAARWDREDYAEARGLAIGGAWISVGAGFAATVLDPTAPIGAFAALLYLAGLGALLTLAARCYLRAQNANTARLRAIADHDDRVAAALDEALDDPRVVH